MTTEPPKVSFLDNICYFNCVLEALWEIFLHQLKVLQSKGKGKAVPLQAWTDPEGSRKLRLPDFMTTAQDGGRLSPLHTSHLYPQEILLLLISVRG